MQLDDSPSLTVKEIASRLAPFCARLSDDALMAVSKYIDLLRLWNHKVSLTTIEEPLEIVARHFGESIFIGNLVNFSYGRLADVGSGAGFPGLPLKIAFPELEIFLIEPNIKKCAFLTEVMTELNLRGVQIIRKQYANIGSEIGKFDFICSRAIGNYKNLLRWARGRLDLGGRVILSVGLEDSIQMSREEGWIWETPIRLPESRKRMIVVGRRKD